MTLPSWKLRCEASQVVSVGLITDELDEWRCGGVIVQGKGERRLRSAPWGSATSKITAGQDLV